MDTKQLAKDPLKQGESSSQRSQAAQNKSPFCLRLNALRALACISVIITHIVGFDGLDHTLRSLHFGGHMAVFFFFSLSGYLLSVSLVKEVRRRVYENKDQNEISKTVGAEERRRLLQNQSLSPEIVVLVGGGELTPTESQALRDGIFSLIRALKQIQKSALVSILRKYLWNRTWRLFPMYYGCWCILKFFATDRVGVQSLQPGIPWKGIFLLQKVPGHLWTMRIEIIFYYTVIPAFICGLYTAFMWQKKGFKQVSEVAFASIVGALLYAGVHGMLAGEPVIHPVAQSDSFILNLPPFCFGLIAGLVNFALELRFKARQATRGNEQPAEREHEESINPWIRRVNRISEYTFSVLNEKKYSIIFYLCGLRIVLLNPAFITMFTGKNEYPNWVLANLNSYWYAIFILINDSRGGFWKLMHPNPSESNELRPVILHKIIYYFGLWSYPIYLTHPISYVSLSQFFTKEKAQLTLEFSLFAVVMCLILGGICDLVFDKILVNKIIFGKVIPGLSKLRKILFSKKKTPVLAKASS